MRRLLAFAACFSLLACGGPSIQKRVSPPSGANERFVVSGDAMIYVGLVNDTVTGREFLVVKGGSESIAIIEIRPVAEEGHDNSDQVAKGASRGASMRAVVADGLPALATLGRPPGLSLKTHATKDPKRRQP